MNLNMLYAVAGKNGVLDEEWSEVQVVENLGLKPMF